MTVYQRDHLVILAGGESRRMGQDKALVEIRGKRMIDHIIDRCRSYELPIILSANQSYGTGLVYVKDQPENPAGPVGAIFSLVDYFAKQEPPVQGFYTLPVDAPNAPADLISKLTADSCAVASSNGQLHPVFAYWKCDTIKSVKRLYNQGGRPPSMRWLASKCEARIINWSEDRGFANINTPDELRAINGK